MDQQQPPHADVQTAMSQQSSGSVQSQQSSHSSFHYPPQSTTAHGANAGTPPSPREQPHALPVPPPPTSSGQTSTVSTERPRSIIEVAVNTGTANPAGRRVRVQWLNEALTRWDSLPRTSVIYLSFKTVMTLVKLVTTITLLAMTPNHRDCSLLGLMMILYTLHAVIDYPFAFLRQLQPIRLNQPLTPQQRLMIHEKSLMEVLGTCLFFVSNYFLFQSAGCRRGVPALFYGLLSFVIIDYIGILVPLILCLAAIFCMPLLIRVLTNLDIALGLAGPTGATEDLINTIPIVKYRKPASASAAATAATAAATVTPPPPAASSQTQLPSASNDTSITIDTPEPLAGADTEQHNPAADASLAPAPSSPPSSSPSSSSVAAGKQKQKQKLLGFSFRRKNKNEGQASSSTSPKEDEYLTLEDEQDATCSICLCEYEDDEELRKMPCLHYFHKACVDEWLKLHKSCPLCKRDIDEGADDRNRSRRQPSQPTQPLMF